MGSDEPIPNVDLLRLGPSRTTMTTATDLYLQALAGETVYHPEVWALVPSSCPHDNPDLELAGQIVGETTPFFRSCT